MKIVYCQLQAFPLDKIEGRLFKFSSASILVSVIKVSFYDFDFGPWASSLAGINGRRMCIPEINLFHVVGIHER